MSGLNAALAWSARVTSGEAPTLAERRPWDDPFPARALTASSDSPVRSTISVTCSIAARPSNQPAKISHLQRKNSQDHDHCWLNSPVDGRELLEVAAEYQRGALAEMSAAGAIIHLVLPMGSLFSTASRHLRSRRRNAGPRDAVSRNRGSADRATFLDALRRDVNFCELTRSCAWSRCSGLNVRKCALTDLKATLSSLHL